MRKTLACSACRDNSALCSAQGEAAPCLVLRGVQVQQQELVLPLRALQRLQVGALQEARVLSAVRRCELAHKGGGCRSRVLGGRVVCQQPRPSRPKQRRQGERDDALQSLCKKRASGTSGASRVRATHRRSEANHSADHDAYETKQWTQHCGRRRARTMAFDCVRFTLCSKINARDSSTLASQRHGERV